MTPGPAPHGRPAPSEDPAATLARLQDALAQLPTGLAIFTARRTLAFHNQRFLELLGHLPRAPAFGTSLSVTSLDDLLHALGSLEEYSSTEARLFLATELTRDRSRSAQSRRTRTDGVVIDLQSTPGADGGWTMAVSDVSALARAEEETRARAALLDTVLRHVPHGISVYGPDRRLQLFNDSYNDIMAGAPIALGDSVDEIIVRRARAGEFGPGDPEQHLEQQRAHDNTKPQFRRRRRPGGQTIDIRTAPLPDGGHISVVTNVTGHLAMEAEAARHTAHLDAMIANIRHGIVLWDRDARIIAANSVVAQMLNAPPELLVPGRSLAETVQSALDRGTLGDGAIGLARAQRLIEQDRSIPQQDQRLTRDGRVIEVRCDPTPEGGFVTTYTDVTQIRQAEEALLLSKAAAEAANAAKSRFLAAMSTELRTPLNTILRESATLTRAAIDHLARSAGRFPETGGWITGPVQDSCTTITQSARALLGLIDNVLDVARLEAGRFDLADDHVDLPQLVRACLRQFDSAAAAAEIALVVELPDDLPKLRADERRLAQALGHLVSNALKFTDAMGSVSIGAKQDWSSGGLLLLVQDTGVGIADSELERVFEPFATLNRAHTTPGASHQGSGAGLGLYISRILLRAHGGDLVLRSIEGQGTTATLHIPANRVLQPVARNTT